MVENGDGQRDHTPRSPETAQRNVTRRPLKRGPAPSVLDHVAARIIELPSLGALIAIDGPDGAGKTHFADNLAELLHSRYQRHVVRVSVDHFHNVRELRYRQGRHSPQGFWEDSYDYSRFRSDVLEPFAPGGPRRYRQASYCHETDEVLYPAFETADPAAVLVVDGIFLHRAELSSAWDLSVFLDVSFTETARRMALRDGTPPDPEHPITRRYVEGQRLYFRQCSPQEHATILIDNNDVDAPITLRG